MRGAPHGEAERRAKMVTAEADQRRQLLQRNRIFEMLKHIISHAFQLPARKTASHTAGKIRQTNGAMLPQ